MSHLIKHIIIDDDSKIKLIGNIAGNVSTSKMPILGWKNYWYGKYKIISYLYNRVDKQETIVNSRFDIMNNSNARTQSSLLQFIREQKFTKNKFMFDKLQNGIDNIYMGNISTMFKLTHTFFHNLDYILSKAYVKNQENLVYILNEVLFEKKLKQDLLTPSFTQSNPNGFHFRNLRTFV